MTRVSPMPPDLVATIRDLKARVDSLERTQPQATTLQHQTGLTFTAPTDLPIRAPRDFRAETLWADAPTAVAADTTWELRRNGTAVGTVTIVTGDSHGHATLDPPVVGDVFDVFTVTRTAGTDPATVRVLGRSTSPDSPAVGGGGCSPVPGGSLQCDETIGQVATGDPLVSVNVSRTSANFDAYFTHNNDFTWTAVVDCTVFASFSATVSSGGTENTLGLFSTSAGGSYASGPDGASLVGNDLIEVAAGDDIWLELTHDGGGLASVYDARLTLLLVCAAASESPPS